MAKRRAPKVKAKAKAKAKPKKKVPAARPAKRAPAKRAPVRKPRPLTPTQKAAATRARKAREAKALAKKRSASAKKGAATRARRKRARAKNAKIVRKVGGQGPGAFALYRTLAGALETMAEISPYRLELELVAPPDQATPWLITGLFRCELDYEQLGEVFATWRDDLILDATIHPQRLSFIRWIIPALTARERRLTDPNDDPTGISATSVGTWNHVISKAASECDPSVDDSFAARYAESLITGIYVHFSAKTLTGVRTVEL